MALRFTEDYAEQVRLRDGRQVLLRLVRPSDKPLLAEGIHRLSPDGRYRRFFVPRNSLSSKDLSYLTEIDQINHFAIGAIEEVDGKDQGLGVARFVRLGGEPKVAEAAIAIADDAQRLGLGQVMFERIIEAARERGIDKFRSDVLAENQAMLALLDKLGGSDTSILDAGVLTTTLELPALDDPTATKESAMYGLLQASAQQKVFLKRFLAWLGQAAEPSDT